MTRPRSLLIPLVIVACLVTCAPALADPSGGAAAPAPARAQSGGVIGPEAPPPVEDAEAANEPVAAPEVAAEPDAGAAQEPTPTTPEGEGQNGEGDPDQGVEEDTGGGLVDGVDDGNQGTPGGEGTAGAEGAGFLPSTGFELGAIAAIGLGLLMLGTALRPRERSR